MASSIVEQIIATAFAGLTGVETAVGRRELNRHAKAKRVVAVPMGAPEISLPDRHGDARYSDKGRILLVRHFQVDWFCHGARISGDTTDFSQAELLYLAMIVAVRQATHHSVVFSDERWIDQEENGDGLERYGSVIAFTSTIAIPIYEARGVVVTLTATPKIDTTFTLNGHEE